jgi:hypothetical protein
MAGQRDVLVYRADSLLCVFPPAVSNPIFNGAVSSFLLIECADSLLA